jgi:ectoine hydroxylase-related dioxygenase (phytanoyl-CoA dioxygenase family)
MTASARYSSAEIESFAEAALRDGYVVLPQHLRSSALDSWRAAFKPLLERHIEREGHLKNRGAHRYYVTLPFAPPFADPAIYEDDAILAIVERLVGSDAVLCQLATDTPLKGSQYQDLHRDAPPLFPEMVTETPPFQLAVNFPLVDVNAANGPTEIAKGTHMIPKQEALRRLEAGEVQLTPVYMRAGDVMVRDVRGIHRGTPNTTDVPRPMVVLGYNRKWLFRPEVSIRVPRDALAALSPRARQLLRYNPIVQDVAAAAEEHEGYQSFAY